MNNKKQKRVFLFLLIGVVAAGMFSCEKQQIQFGSQFIDNSYTQIYEVDTIRPLVSTVFIDSFVTSGTGIGLIGTTVDTAFGTIKSSSYFQLGIPAYNSTGAPYKNAVLDSVTIFFKIKRGVWYGDTTKPITLNVYRLTQIINPQINSTVFRNRDTVAAEATPFATASFMIYPTRGDSLFDTLQIRLPDTLGQSLLTKLQTADYAIQNNNQFLTYFSGVKITGDPRSNLSIGISDSIQMRVYYTTPGLPIPTESIATFGLYNASYQFNNISVAPRTGALAKVGISKSNNEILSSQTGNLGYLLPVANAMVKIRFPSLYYVAQLNYIRIQKATLLIRPQPGTYTGMFQLPPSLQLIPTDYNFGYTSSPLATSGTTTAQTGNLGVSYQGAQFSAPYYIYDVTAYLQSLISSPASNINQDGLFLAPSPGMFTSYPRLLIGDATNANAQMQLQIQYLSIQ